VLRRAEEAERRRALHLAWADWFRGRDDEALGRHLLEAGEFAGAVLPLLSAAERYLARGEARRALALLDLVETAFPFVAGTPELDGQRTQSQVRRGRALWMLGRYRDAEQVFRQAIDVLGTGSPLLLGEALLGIGLVQKRLGRVDEARDSFDRALSLYRHFLDRGQEARALALLAGIDYEHGRWAEAEPAFLEALAVQRQIGDRAAESHALLNLAAVHLDRAELDQATSYYETALAIARDMGNRRTEGHALGGLGIIAIERNPNANTEMLEQAIQICRDVGESHRACILLVNLAYHEFRQGRLPEARAHYEQALVEAPGLREVGIIKNNVALVLALEGGDPKDVDEQMRAGEQALRAVGDRLELGKLLCRKGRIAELRGDRSGARAALEEARAIGAELAVPATSELATDLAELAAALAS
jgi:tetratricopeptide (TPR) repeat protein